MSRIQIIAHSDYFKEWEGVGTPPTALTQFVYDILYPENPNTSPDKETKAEIAEFLAYLKEYEW